MRPPQELWFRLRQEIANLALAIHPPRLETEQPAPLALLPAPEQVAERLRGTPFEGEILALAEKILAHRFPLLGVEIDTGPRIQWRRDYLAGIETRPVYFRRVPYLDQARTGDHKIIWELNRHQHLVVLAQALLLTGDKRFGTELRAQFESWALVGTLPSADAFFSPCTATAVTWQAISRSTSRRTPISSAKP